MLLYISRLYKYSKKKKKKEFKETKTDKKVRRTVELNEYHHVEYNQLKRIFFIFPSNMIYIYKILVLEKYFKI